MNYKSVISFGEINYFFPGGKSISLYLYNVFFYRLYIFPQYAFRLGFISNLPQFIWN
jgi:hypothetical protein